jgi:hypothetical protein
MSGTIEPMTSMSAKFKGGFTLMARLRKSFAGLALGVAAVALVAAPAWADTGTWRATNITPSYHCSLTEPGPKASTWLQSCVVVNGSYWQSATIATVTGVRLSYSIAADSEEIGLGDRNYVCSTKTITSGQSMTCFGTTHSNSNAYVRAAGDIAVNGFWSEWLYSPWVLTS